MKAETTTGVTEITNSEIHALLAYPKADFPFRCLLNIAMARARLLTNFRAPAIKVALLKTGHHKNIKVAAQNKLAFYPNLQRERENVINIQFVIPLLRQSFQVPSIDSIIVAGGTHCPRSNQKMNPKPSHLCFWPFPRSLSRCLASYSTEMICIWASVTKSA